VVGAAVLLDEEGVEVEDVPLDEEGVVEVEDVPLDEEGVVEVEDVPLDEEGVEVEVVPLEEVEPLDGAPLDDEEEVDPLEGAGAGTGDDSAALSGSSFTPRNSTPDAFAADSSWKTNDGTLSSAGTAWPRRATLA
jgi:hypothetical protein